MARIALAMPHGSKRVEIDKLLNLPQSYASKRPLLTAAAIAGEFVPSETLLAGIKELIQIAETQSWRLDDERGELMDWLELFPFSDRPITVLDALELLPPAGREPARLRRLLSAITQGDPAEALHLIEELKDHDPGMLAERDWQDALIKLETEASAQLLLDLVCEGQLPARGREAHWYSDHLAKLAKEFPAVRDEMLQRLETAGMEPATAILKSALAEIADERVLTLLIHRYAADGRSLDGLLNKAIRNIAVGQRPAADWHGAFEQFGVPLTALRKDLFGMREVDNALSSLAEQCLTSIDALRDDYGYPDDEPRHPDIGSGHPWPQEVGDPTMSS